MVTAEEIRAVALALPRTTEALVRDRVKFRVGRIVYVALSRDETTMGCGYPRELRAAAVAAEPEKFFLPRPSDMRYQWIEVRLASIGADEMRELVTDAWRMCVPKRVAAAHLGENPGTQSRSGAGPELVVKFPINLIALLGGPPMLLSRLSRSARTWAVRLSAVGAAAALVALGGSLGVSSAAQADADAHAKPLPAHVFSPYFEAYTTDSPAALSSASGAKYLTLAFLQTASPGSCEVDWNGNTATPVSQTQKVYGTDIAAIRAAGGDVVPSFGGYGADTTNTELADSCTSVPAIAAEFERVITTYGVTRLDLDVEADSLTNTAGIDRRNKAIALVEKWADRTDRVVQFVYTIPTFATGLTSAGQALLANAVANHARIDIVNIMTFDYYDNQPHEMGNDSIEAAGALFNTLHGLYPNLPPQRLWKMVGLTNMVGIDDFGPAETFTEADATLVEHWAAAHGIGELSFWAIERDNDNNGACIGLQGQGSCSGVAQSTWDFSHTFEPFTRP